MTFHSLQARFLLAGCLLVTTTAACGAWSAFTFFRLSSGVGQSIRASQEAIDLTAVLAGSLEREDDALLLSLGGETEPARKEVTARRQQFDTTYDQLGPLLQGAEERQAAAGLRQHADTYRTAGDALLNSAALPDARNRYHREVNPALRQAVADCGRLRELAFAALQQASLRAGDEARRATGIVAGIALASLLLSSLVALGLARSIVRPVRELTECVEAVRKGDFGRRVRVSSADELGRLAEGFNRMAETLADYRHSSLGELLLAKGTLEATLAALPDAVIVIDPDGRVVSTNSLARAVLPTAHASAGQVEDLPLSEESVRAVRHTLSGARPGGSPKDLGRVQTVVLDGRPRKLALSVAPIPEFVPRRRGAVVVLDDVTEFLRLDELRGELVAVASHELKTPLTTLRMNLLLLEERPDELSDRQRELVAAAVQGVEELAATIDELLDLTRIEAGQLRIVREPVDLYAVIEQAARSLRSRYEDAEIALRVERDAPRAVVRGDSARLRVVFANLLTNSLKYTPRGGVVVVCVRESDGADGKPVLEVTATDTGRGIPPEFRERVFEKFFRVEHQRPESAGGVRGSGIGLYLCRQVVEAHGGAIRCEAPETGAGTRMVLQLPTFG